MREIGKVRTSTLLLECSLEEMFSHDVFKHFALYLIKSNGIESLSTLLKITKYTILYCSIIRIHWIR